MVERNGVRTPEIKKSTLAFATICVFLSLLLSGEPLGEGVRVCGVPMEKDLEPYAGQAGCTLVVNDGSIEVFIPQDILASAFQKAKEEHLAVGKSLRVAVEGEEGVLVQPEAIQEDDRLETVNEKKKGYKVNIPIRSSGKNGTEHTITTADGSTIAKINIQSVSQGKATVGDFSVGGKARGKK